MKVNVTLDYVDGSQSVVKTCRAEDIPTGPRLAMLLHNPGVAGITITRADMLGALRKEQEKEPCAT